MKIKHVNEFPSALNYVIRPLSECAISERKENGYHIVNDVWGTCHFRISNTRDKVSVRCYADKKTLRSYTNIPASIQHKIYHVLVNFRKYEGFLIKTQGFFKIIGFHEPITHVSNSEYLTQTFLIYAKQAPEIVDCPNKQLTGGYFMSLEEIFIPCIKSTLFPHEVTYFTLS